MDGKKVCESVNLNFDASHWCLDQNINWIRLILKIPQFEDFSRWTPTPGPQSVQTPPLLLQCLLLMFLSGCSKCRQRWDQALLLCSPGSWSPGVPAEGLISAELVQGNILVFQTKTFSIILEDSGERKARISQSYDQNKPWCPHVDSKATEMSIRSPNQESVSTQRNKREPSSIPVWYSSSFGPWQCPNIWLILRCWGKSSIICQQNSDAL